LGSVTEEKVLGKRLQDARRQAGLTQQELCHQAGLSYSTLAKIERGAIASPSVFTVAAIAQATGASVEELLGVRAKAPAPPSAKKTSKTGIRFVYFDIDGVLISDWHHAFNEASETTGLPVDQIENAFWRHSDAACRGELSLAQFDAAMAKDLHLKSFDWLKHYLKSAKIQRPVQDLLAWAAEHYEVGLLHNHMAGVYEALLERGLIPKLDYKVVIDSSKVGAVKPEAKIYEIASRRAGVKPNEILLIDDLRPNLTAADRAGWQIAHYDPLHADASLTRIKELLAF